MRQMISSGRAKWQMPEPVVDMAAPGKAASKLPLIWFDDVAPCLDASDIIEDTICDGQMSVVYGESNCGKTFFASDLALHLAIGQPWRGKAVEAGGVIYVAAEGGFGIRNRVAAFRQARGYGGVEVPFGIVPASVNLLDPAADTPRLIELIQQAAEQMAVPIRLVVIDTLSRAMLRVMATDNMKNRMMTLGADVTPLGPDEFAAYVKADDKRLTPIIKSLDMKSN
jgi:RecA-family ATPase